MKTRVAITTAAPVKSINSPRYRSFLLALKAARRAAGLSQEGLAAKLGRPQSFVSKVEVGERKLDIVEFVEWTEAINSPPMALLEALRKEPLEGAMKRLRLRRRTLLSE